MKVTITSAQMLAVAITGLLLPHRSLQLVDVDDPPPDGVLEQLDPVVEAELLHQASAVVVDRLLAKVENLGDLPVGVAHRREEKHLPLPFAQQLVRVLQSPLGVRSEEH